MISNHEQIQAITTREIEQLLRRFADGQEHSDVETLAALLTDDFKLVGPLGFVLDKQQWLAQFRPGALEIESLEWDELDVRAHGRAQLAIVIGRLRQRAAYAGRPPTELSA